MSSQQRPVKQVFHAKSPTTWAPWTKGIVDSLAAGDSTELSAKCSHIEFIIHNIRDNNIFFFFHFILFHPSIIFSEVGSRGGGCLWGRGGVFILFFIYIFHFLWNCVIVSIKPTVNKSQQRSCTWGKVFEGWPGYSTGYSRKVYRSLNEYKSFLFLCPLADWTELLYSITVFAVNLLGHDVFSKNLFAQSIMHLTPGRVVIFVFS